MQLDVKLMAGVCFSVGSLVFAALGNVFSKTAGRTLAKELISAYIGASILAIGVIWYLIEPYFMALVLDEEEMENGVPFWPEDPWILVQSVGVVLLGAFQQYFNISKYSEIASTIKP